jgi:ATP-dependent exoDNAse (exonuclease V) beta subunit
MKFAYPEMSTVPFNGMRFYETPEGKFYPSITTVLGDTQSEEKKASLRKWQMSLGMSKAQEATEAASNHGTNVHLLCERYLKKEPMQQPGDTFAPTEIAAFNALKLKLNKIEDVWGQEVALYSNILELAGRCDCVGVYKGKPSIIDFKTSSRLKTKAQVEDYRLQITAYSIMHNEMFGTNITNGVILMTSAGGFPQEFSVDLLDYVEPLAKRVEDFYAKLSATL